MSKTIYLMRHGAVDGPAALYGVTDVGVTAQGLAAMNVSAQNIANIGQVFTSPRRRCTAFADNYQGIVIDDLGEMNFGVWDGKPFDDQMDNWPGLSGFWTDPNNHPPPQGETLNIFYHRVLSGWHQLLSQAKQESVLVVCHGGVIRMILAYLLGVDHRLSRWHTSLSIDYAGLTRIDIPSDAKAAARVKFVNYLPVKSKER